MEEELIEARALKESFLLSQMAMNTASQVLYNDDKNVWCLAAAAASEEFPVEDLLNLDFSDKDETSFGNEDETNLEKEGGSNKSSCSNFSDFDTVSTGELPFPVEDEESLEWLSQFVDDSTAAISYPTGSFTANSGSRTPSETVIEPQLKTRSTFLDTAVPRKARSKRERLTGLLWSLMSPSLSSVDSSSPSSSCHDSSSLPAAAAPPSKKEKRTRETENGVVSGRRCTHCQVQKTPQWRTGPLGPKTLCNACGVRFKSGRLFPEYRPACSPTFSKEVHSNSHRKVLEMRLKKEVAAVGSSPESVVVSDKF